MIPGVHPDDEQLTAYVLGELSQDHLPLVAAHVHACAACTTLMHAAQATGELLRMVKVPALSLHMRGALMNSFAQHQAPQTFDNQATMLSPQLDVFGSDATIAHPGMVPPLHDRGDAHNFAAAETQIAAMDISTNFGAISGRTASDFDGPSAPPWEADATEYQPALSNLAFPDLAHEAGLRQGARSSIGEVPLRSPSVGARNITRATAQPEPDPFPRAGGVRPAVNKKTNVRRILRPALTLAASVLLLIPMVGAGYFVILKAQERQSSTDTATGSEAPKVATEVQTEPNAAATIPAGTTPVLATGTAYTKAQLEQQTRDLIATLAKSPNAAANTGTNTDTATMRTLVASKEQLSKSGFKDDPAIAGCVSAIDRASIRPLAVDLATYEGQEVAVVVLPGEIDGYETWVVSRTCSSANDGAVTFLKVPAAKAN